MEVQLADAITGETIEEGIFCLVGNSNSTRKFCRSRLDLSRCSLHTVSAPSGSLTGWIGLTSIGDRKKFWQFFLQCSTKLDSDNPSLLTTNLLKVKLNQLLVYLWSGVLESPSTNRLFACTSGSISTPVTASWQISSVKFFSGIVSITNEKNTLGWACLT